MLNTLLMSGPNLMTKTQRKKKVEQLGTKYRDKLHLGEWHIDFVISDDYDNGDGAAGECRSSHVYRNATITLYQCAFKKPNDLEHIIKHELSHCLTDPLYKYCYDFLNGRFRTHHDIEDQREILTEWIAKLI